MTKIKVGESVRKTAGKWSRHGQTFKVLAIGKRRLRLQPLFKVGGYDLFPISVTLSNRWVTVSEETVKAAAA